SKPGLGWLPDVPKREDYGPQHPNVVESLQKTRLAPMTAPAGGGVSDKDKGTKAKAKTGGKLPSKADLRKWFSPIEHQGSLGSCTAHAAVALLEYFQRRACGKHTDASPLFVYKATRNLQHWTGDTGAYLRTAMEALVLFGAPPEEYWPYDGAPADSNPHFDVEPPAFAYAFAANYQAIKYFRLDADVTPPTKILENIRRSLAGEFPVMFGFPVYSEFDNPENGYVAYPAGAGYRGGHAIVAAGYDDNLTVAGDIGALLVRNSWGTGWADSGYAWMSYRYVTEGLATDWWSMVKAEWVDDKQFA
ncbi:MAG: C1 family peptidase, partial [Candidatus Binatia bacterium]